MTNLKSELVKLLAVFSDNAELPGREWKRMVQGVVDKCEAEQFKHDPMTAIEKMVQWFKDDNRAERTSEEDELFTECWAEARRLLAEERDAPPQGLVELKNWAMKQKIYTDPEVEYDSHDLAEAGGYQSAMWNVAGKIDAIISRYTTPTTERDEMRKEIEKWGKEVRTRAESAPATKKRSIMELRGVGKEIWNGIDAQEYVNQERGENPRENCVAKGGKDVTFLHCDDCRNIKNNDGICAVCSGFSKYELIPPTAQPGKPLTELKLWEKIVKIVSHHPHTLSGESVADNILDILTRTAPTAQSAPINLTELKLWVIKERNDHASNDPNLDGFMVLLCNKIDELTVTPAPTELPLAELADRKGYDILLFHRGDWEADIKWQGDINSCVEDSKVVSNTYTSCESKAREYLNGLPDKK